MAKYATVAEIRGYTGISEDEFSDTSVNNMIDSATERIDRETGKTWQGIQTVTDEYYKGSGTEKLLLDNVDITSLDALSINISPTGTTYTDITVTKARVADGIGLVELQPNAEVPYFPEYQNSTKATYKHGSATIPDDIKLACRYLVAFTQKFDEKINSDYYKTINRYKVIRISTP